MSTQELTVEQEKFLAPFRLSLLATVNGVKVSSDCFIRQANWDGADTEEERREQIRTAFQSAAEDILDLIGSQGLMHR
jgi:hypothetical protein